jgi:opacity protein-like surface antigen
MKYIFTSLSLLAITFLGTINADYCCQCEKDYSFYIKVGSGISCSESANVFAPPSTWNPAVQGYNSTLGNQPIAEIGLGCQLMRLVDLELNVSARSNFKYRKFQTPLNGSSSYTREFDLTVIPILFSINVLGRDIPYLNWEIACGKIYPVIGASVGISHLHITNFRTTGLPPIGGSIPFPSFSAENQSTHRHNFTYTALIGIEYAHNDRWAVTTGYRWFDAGRFKGPRFQRVSTGSAVDIAGEEWKMDFKSNEWFIEFKIFL